jgi:hypothetical protein
MSYYAIRIDAPLSVSAEIVAVQQKKDFDPSSIFIVAHEISDKEKKSHFHSILKIEDINKVESLRKRIKRAFKLQKASEYSIKRLPNEEEEFKYIAYIMKQNNIVHKSGISDELYQLALDRVSKIETEKHISLVDKVFNHLENSKFDPLDDYSFLQAVMKYFTENKLTYPSRNWMNSLRVKFFVETKKEIDSDLKSEQIARVYGMDNYSMRSARLEIDQLKQKVKLQQEEIYKINPPKPYNNSKNIEKVKALFETEDYTIDFE